MIDFIFGFKHAIYFLLDRVWIGWLCGAVISMLVCFFATGIIIIFFQWLDKLSRRLAK